MLAAQFSAIQARHQGVGQQQVDRSGMLRSQPQGVDTAGSLEHVISVSLENLADSGPNHRKSRRPSARRPRSYLPPSGRHGLLESVGVWA